MVNEDGTWADYDFELGPVTAALVAGGLMLGFSLVVVAAGALEAYGRLKAALSSSRCHVAGSRP